MNVTSILAIIQGGSALFKAITGIIDNVKDTLSEDDLGKIEAALADLQAENDAIFDRVNAKLTEAAKK